MGRPRFGPVAVAQRDLKQLLAASASAQLGFVVLGAGLAAVAVEGIAVLGGLMFKSGAVPAHFWVPDAAQGAGTTAAAFLTTVPKIGALVAAYRLVSALPGTLDRSLLVTVLAVTSMTLGNFAA